MSLHRYFLQNGVIRECREASLFPGQLGLLSGWGVFSTLRVVDGALFAWEKHWARLSYDAALLKVEMPADPNSVERDLLRLIESNGVSDCTLRFVVVRNGGGMWEGPGSERASDTIALTANSKKWGDSVRLGIQPRARYAASEFTRAKMLSWAQNLRWAERAQEQDLDEVILLNEYDRVSECTSANLFAAFGGEVFTPAVSEGCLPGITRDVLVTEVQVAGIKVSERGLTIGDLEQADEVFITSTTRGLLPVREIAGRVLENRGDNCRRLADAFDEYVRSDIARRKTAQVAV